MVKITACLVVYNEEKIIRRCLDSLKGAVDEIVLIHDGPCSDKTLEIVREYTKKIYIAERKGDAAPHRQYSISKAAGDWVLIVDADEFLTPELRKNLKKLAEDKEADAYAFLTEVWCAGKPMTKGTFSRFYRTMFYRKNKISPERVRVNGVLQTTGRTKKADYLIGHRPERDNYSMAAFKTRWMRLITLEAKELAELGMAKKNALTYLTIALPAFLKHFWTVAKQGSLLSGWRGLKITFYMSLYYFMLNIELFKLKLERKSEWTKK